MIRCRRRGNGGAFFLLLPFGKVLIFLAAAPLVWGYHLLDLPPIGFPADLYIMGIGGAVMLGYIIVQGQRQVRKEAKKSATPPRGQAYYSNRR